MKLQDPYAGRMRAFVEALRTTSITQTTFVLRKTNDSTGGTEMCAEGLLFDVALGIGLDGKWTQHRSGGSTTWRATTTPPVSELNALWHNIELPRDAYTFMVGSDDYVSVYGLIDDENGHPEADSLMAMNDRRRCTFSQIADAVERFYELTD